MLNQNKNWIKAYIIDVLPCISIAFFLLAFIYTDSFYTVFGIDIVRYTTFGDVFMSITTPLVIFAFFALIALSVFYDLFIFILPATLENKEKHILNFKLPFGVKYKWLCTIVKIKNTRLGKYLATLKSNIAKIKNTRFWGYLVKSKSNNSGQRSWGIMSHIVILSIIYFILGHFYFILVKDGVIRPTLLSSAFALLIPLVIFPMAEFYITLLTPFTHNRGEGKNWQFKMSKGKIIILLIGYYIYAISMFNAIGREEALSIKNNNQAKFEIVTSDGNIYNSEKYGYIGHLSEHTFLYDKKNGWNVILNNEGIISTKIIDKKHQQDSFSYFFYSIYEEALKKIDYYLKIFNNAIKHQ